MSFRSNRLRIQLPCGEDGSLIELDDERTPGRKSHCGLFSPQCQLETGPECSCAPESCYWGTACYQETNQAATLPARRLRPGALAELHRELRARRSLEALEVDQ